MQCEMLSMVSIHRPLWSMTGAWPIALVVCLTSSLGCTRPAPNSGNRDSAPDASATTKTPASIQDSALSAECAGEADRLLALSRQDTADRTLTLLGEAYRRCGDGHGLLSAIAQVQLQQGKLSKAAEALKQELLSPWPAPRALLLAPQVIARLPADQARELQELGSTPTAPVHMRSILGERDAWLTGVTCRGQSPTAFALGKPSPERPALYMASVECPAGVKHTVFLWKDTPPNPKPPPFSLDRPTPDVAFILDRVRTKFGITSASELREELLDATPSRSQAWLLEGVADYPNLIRVWASLIEEDPNDLEALISRAAAQAAVGDLDGAIATLAHASPQTARLRDLRGTSRLKSSAIRSHQCAFLYMQRKLDEASARCKEGLAAGSQVTSNAYLARIALLRGQLAEAEAFAKQAAPGGHGREWTLLGIALTLQGKTNEARAWLLRATQEHPPFRAAQMLLSGVSKTAEGWMAEEESEDRENMASVFAANCGHIYLDLGVIERSERCFRLSEGLAYGPSEAARALHLSETDPQKALRALEPVSKRSQHADVMVAMAGIEHRLGRDAEALPWLERALQAWPGHSGAESVRRDVCGKLGDAGCAGIGSRGLPDAGAP